MLKVVASAVAKRIQVGDIMAKATEINIDVKLNLKFRVWDILKLRLAGIKGKALIDEFMQRVKAPTCVLVNDLAKREGVQEIVINPHQPFIIQVKNADGSEFKYPSKIVTGPARILVVID